MAPCVDANVLADGGPPDTRPDDHKAMGRQAPYDVEQALVYLIDLQPWELRHGFRWLDGRTAGQSPTVLVVRPEETHGQPGSVACGGP